MAARTGRLRSTKMTLAFGGSEPQPKPQPQSQSHEATSCVQTPELKPVEQKNQKKPSSPQPQPQSKQASDRDKGQDGKPARDFRTMRPDIKEKFLTKLVEALGVDTIEQVPVLFRQERIKPAKIGLFNDLVVRFPNNLDMKELKSILRTFFGDFAYHHSITGEKQRFDLDMNPVEGEQGEILEKHKLSAYRHIQRKRKGIKKLQQKQKRLAEAEANTTSAEQGMSENKD